MVGIACMAQVRVETKSECDCQKKGYLSFISVSEMCVNNLFEKKTTLIRSERFIFGLITA